MTAPAASTSAARAPAAPTCDCPHCRGKHRGEGGHGHHGPGHEGCEHGAHGDGSPEGPGPHAGGGPHGPGPHPGGPAGGRHHAHAHDEGAHHDFSDAERWAKVFDDPARDAWQKPDEVVRWLALAPTDLVVDLGAGTGYFTVRLARAVPKGKVVALDVEANMVKFVEARAAKEQLTNIVARVTPADRPAIEERPNVVLIVNTYHHLTDRQPYLREIAKTLAPKGRIVVVDFRKGDLPVGPPDAHKIAPEAVTAEMKAAGLSLCGALDTLPHQYVLAYALACK
ncbi:MAG: methyltransferase domain-containing protein [Polyangiaceae bacterium]|nr:methyltransferase domain-containing protein [Polyangiaceae bacterium]